MKAKPVLVPALLGFFLIFNAARGATLTVTSTADSGSGSLRDALAAAASGDTIDATGVSGTILLTSGELLVTNNLTILGPGPNVLAVNGNAASTVFYIRDPAIVSLSSLLVTNGYSLNNVSGGGIYNDQATLTVSNCTISGNLADLYDGGGGGGIENAEGMLTIVNCAISSNSGNIGGGIFNEGGTLTMSNCTVSHNSGSGIYNDSGTLTVANCNINSNFTQRSGGGIDSEYNYTSATTMITNCTISSNSAIAGGGIFDLIGTLTVANSVISSNSAYGGGGIFSDGRYGSGTLIITNCTLNGNSGDGIENDGDNGGTTMTIINSALYNNSGDGIDNEGAYGSAVLTIINSTLSSNAGGIFNYNNYGTATLTILSSTLNTNTILNVGTNNNGATTLQIGNTIMNAGLQFPSIINSGGTVTSEGYNLTSDSGGGHFRSVGDQISTNPKLGPLQNNGGPTFTHALLLGSPGIDKGKNFNGSATDQRGQLRTYDNPAIPNAVGGTGTDIGAFEFIPPILTIAPNFGNVELSWSSSDPGYMAQSTSSLLNPGNTWTNVPGTPLVIGNQYLLGDGPATGRKFYRLKSP